MTLTQPKKLTHRVDKIEAAVINDIDQNDWDTIEIEIDHPGALDDYDEMSNSFLTEQESNVDNIDSKDKLRQMLKDVDNQLIELYTRRNTLEHKHEKRSLQRLKKKIIDKLNEPD
jgi:succinate dehydrogenase flavin-adding protein (antitoxin of CptAB toxin-antitoxin module)